MRREDSISSSKEHAMMIQVRWYENRYLCPRCKSEWKDEWSCACNDRCPACDLESSPTTSRDLSRQLLPEDFQGAERRLRLKAPLTATAEQARDYAEAMLEGR